MRRVRYMGACAAALTAAACAAPQLERFAVCGDALYPGLETPALPFLSRPDCPAGVERNPEFGREDAFVTSVGRRASQGRQNGEGVDAALYALYREQADVVLYGLEAADDSVAERLEAQLHEIWDYGVGLGRVRLYRSGRVLLVLWHGGVSPACWESLDAELRARLGEAQLR